MKAINPQLKSYIEQYIFPIYEKNDPGHDIHHVEQVIRRSIIFADQFPNLNIDMIYTTAAFHDAAYHIDKKRHEILSAQLFYDDTGMQRFFTPEQRITIKEAIEDHRASVKSKPRSDYGKIITTADRTTSLESALLRTHAYTMRYFPHADSNEMVERAYTHLLEKYGSHGYAKEKHYCHDPEYEQFLRNLAALLNDKTEFTRKYLAVNNITPSK